MLYGDVSYRIAFAELPNSAPAAPQTLGTHSKCCGFLAPQSDPIARAGGEANSGVSVATVNRMESGGKRGCR